MRLLRRFAPRNDKMVYRITYKVYRILCYTYGLLKLNTVILIIIFLSLRRERQGEGDDEGFQGILPLNILIAQ